MNAYWTKRPAAPGAIPTDGLDRIVDLDPTEIIPAIGRGAYNIVIYDRPLTHDEVVEYELYSVERPADIEHKGYVIHWNEWENNWTVTRNGRHVAITDTAEEAIEGIDRLVG